MLFSTLFGIVSAMVGAGFASGREIVTFFSRYGRLSWLLIFFAVLFMGWLMRLIMDGQRDIFPIHDTKTGKAAKALMLLLFAAAGGAMTAAAGKLAALTLPLFHASALGGLLTLCAAIIISHKTVQALGVIGKILIPLMLLAFFFCYCAPVENTHDPSGTVPAAVIALVQLLGYCGLNVTLSAGVIREAGQRCKTQNRAKIPTYVCILVGLLLCAGNAAMLSHANNVQNQALPVVMLLRNYGKTGFYLSAAVLYLAVFSTLIAILRGMRSFLPWQTARKELWAGLFCAAFSLLGFEVIVEAAYAALGWLGILLILGKEFLRNGTKRHFPSSIWRTPNKEENGE